MRAFALSLLLKCSTAPALKTMSDVPKYFSAINELLALGEIRIDELGALINVADKFRASIDLAELEQWIIKIENDTAV